MIGTWMAIDPCVNLGQNSRSSTEFQKTYMVSKQTDEETGHNKTMELLARRMGKYVKKSQRGAINKWAEEKQKLDAAREQRGIQFIPDDDPDL